MTEPSANKPADVQWEQWPEKLQQPVVAVIRYQISSVADPHLYKLLSSDEKNRAARFIHAADRMRFVAGRGLLRLLAGQLTGTPPTQIELTKGPFGKPELLNPPAALANWHVNVSHAGDWILLAFGHVPVGVDVEWVNPTWPYQELIPISFTDNDQALLATDDDPRALFYTFWTRKESLLKATGEGLTNDLAPISSSKGVYEVEHHHPAGTTIWRATSFSVSAGYVGAVACPEPPPAIQFFTIDPGHPAFAAAN